MKSTTASFALALSLAASFAAFANVSALAADAPAVTAAPAAVQAPSDEELTKQVEVALAADAVLKNQKIKVSTKKAEVSLTGVVADQEMMVAAGHLVEKIPGVKYVLNEIDNEDYLREQAAKKAAASK